MADEYWDLYPLVAPGWSLREGYAKGPCAEGPFWIWAPTFEEAVWRTWCAVFLVFEFAPGLYPNRIWPERPEDWRDRIAMARRVWDESQARGRALLEEEDNP